MLHRSLYEDAEVVGMVAEDVESATAGNDARLVSSHAIEYLALGTIHLVSGE